MKIVGFGSFFFRISSLLFDIEKCSSQIIVSLESIRMEEKQAKVDVKGSIENKTTICTLFFRKMKCVACAKHTKCTPLVDKMKIMINRIC